MSVFMSDLPIGISSTAVMQYLFSVFRKTNIYLAMFRYILKFALLRNNVFSKYVP